MQIKQLKSLINGNNLSPWGQDFDLDDFLAPPITQQKQRQSKYKKNQIISSNNKIKSIQQQAKKTLLNIDIQNKNKKVQQLKTLVHNKHKSQNHIIQNQNHFNLKLPPINRKIYNSIQYYNSYINPTQFIKQDLDQIDLFRKYGQHRKNKYRQSKVQRSVSLGPLISPNLQQFTEKKHKIQTLQPISNHSKNDKLQTKNLKLNGKKYSLDIRIQSQRKLNIDKYNYIPSQPNITPHYLLFGHNKQDVLKKVLQQINQKVK